MYLRGSLETSTDLDSLYRSEDSGIYWQNMDKGATDALHYPLNESGTLEIIPCDPLENEKQAVIQRYTGHRTGKIGIRCFRDNAWNNSGSWAIINPTEHKNFVEL